MEKTITLKLTLENKEFTATAVLSEESINRIAGAIAKVDKSSGSVKKVSGEFHGMNQVIGQTGFLLSDMDMFFRTNDWVTNVRMGSMSVANNFSMVGQTIANATAQAKEHGMTLGQAFMTSFTGMNMFLLGLNGGMFLLQLFLKLMDDSANKVKDLSLAELDSVVETDRLATAINKLKKELEDLTQVQLIEYLRKSNQALNKLYSDLAQRSKELNFLNAVFGTSNPAYLDATINKIMDELARNTTITKALEDGTGKINRLRAEIKELTKSRDKAENDAEIRKLQNDIEKKQNIIDSLTGKKHGEKLTEIAPNFDYYGAMTDIKNKQEKIYTGLDAKLSEMNIKAEGNEILMKIQTAYRDLEIFKNDLDEKLANGSIDQGNYEYYLSHGYSSLINRVGKIKSDAQAGADKQIGEMSKDNLENMLNRGSELASDSLDEMQTKIDATRRAWQRMGDVASNMLDRIIHKSLTTEDVLGMLASILLKIGISAILPGAAAEAVPEDAVSYFSSRSMLDSGPMQRLSTNSALTSLSKTIVLQVAPIEIRGRGRDIYGSNKAEQKIIAKYY
jgi:hypothetical protein